MNGDPEILKKDTSGWIAQESDRIGTRISGFIFETVFFLSVTIFRPPLGPT
jgi:hypothetical protein